MNNREQEYCELYSVLFEFYSQVFLAEPDKDLMERIISTNLFSDFPLKIEDETINRFLLEMNNFLSFFESKDLPGLREDYLSLFVGIENILAPPYASVYLDGEGLLYDKTTIAVKEIYRIYNLAPVKNNIPEDHIGLLFYFISVLCKSLSSFLSKNEKEKIYQLSRELISFIEKFILSWYETFQKRISDNSKFPFYKDVSNIALYTLNSLKDFTSNL